MDLKELGDARDALMAELDQEEKLEAAHKASLRLDTRYAEADEFDHARRVEFYAREVAKLAEEILAKKPSNVEEAVEWSAKVMAHARAMCGEWHGVGNATAAWELSEEIYADLLDWEDHLYK